MPALFELLESEDSAAVRAVLGHFAFVFIHPYMDGNGRMARFLMNAMLASGGYPWTIVRLEIRTDYLGTLEQASVHGNIEPFVRLLGFAVRAQADPLYRASAIGRSTDGGAAAEHDSPLYGR
jgi:Fic family protein